MWSHIREGLLADFKNNPRVAEALIMVNAQVGKARFRVASSSLAYNALVP